MRHLTRAQRHGVGRRVFGGGGVVAHVLPVAGVGLDRTSDPIHHAYRLERVLPDGRLGGEHDCIGSVVDRVRHVGRFGARRCRVSDHRFEHLRGGHDRFPSLHRESDEVLLDLRNALRGHLDPEIAARHHHAVDFAQQLGESLHRARLLDLRHQTSF